MAFFFGDTLEHVGTNILVDRFRHAFLNARDDPERYTPLLESIVRELARRPVRQTYNLYWHLEWNFLKSAVQEERYDSAATYRDMLLYYARRVL